MADSLQSALVIGLRETIKWESSIRTASNGTLQPIDPAAQIDVLKYQRRDRELLYRDLIVGAAVVEVAVEVADVWNAEADRPRLQGLTEHVLPFDRNEITSTGTNLSMVRHVKNTSIPWDAARFADADLYGRDGLVYETLARACAALFPQPPIPTIDASGTVYALAGTAAWSLAEGAETAQDISGALPFNRDLFKTPDCNAADRDNQNAAYVARMVRVLSNPFAYANRLYVRVDGPDSRETEVYTLTSEDGTSRVWKCEPALSGRNRIIYYVQSRTLQWIRAETDEVHVPQLYALSIPGLETGQTVVTVPTVPTAKDCQYWRNKAGQVVPNGNSVLDFAAYVPYTDSSFVSGGQTQEDSASMTTPDTLQVTFPVTLGPGVYRTNFLVQPDPEVRIMGAQNASSTSGTLGGVTFADNVASGSVSSISYLVEGGDGIIYNGTGVLPGEVFTGISGSSTYAQLGAVPSTVRQESVVFNLSLPPGPWVFRMEYTNISDTETTTGFGVKAYYNPAGRDPVDVFQDIVPLPFSGTTGQLATTPDATLDVVDSEPFSLPIHWTYGDGQLHIRRLIFESSFASTGSYEMAGGLAGTLAYANFTGNANLPDVVSFLHSVGTNLASPVFALAWTGPSEMPIRVLEADIQQVGTFTATPVSEEFAGWRTECVERAELAIQQAFQKAISASGTSVPSFITTTTGSIWDETSTENWMAFIEQFQPRLRHVPAVSEVAVGFQYVVASGAVSYGTEVYGPGETFYGVESSGTVFSGGVVDQTGALQVSRPGHIGLPALVPNGVYFAYGTTTSPYPTASAYPRFVSCQPWMVKAGAYVVRPEFWMPEQL